MNRISRVINKAISGTIIAALLTASTGWATATDITTPGNTNTTCTISGPVTSIPTCPGAAGAGGHSGNTAVIGAAVGAGVVLAVILVWRHSHHKAAPAVPPAAGTVEPGKIEGAPLATGSGK